MPKISAFTKKIGVKFEFQDGSLRWFDLASANQISSAQCKFNEAICMALSPDESYCFVGSSDGILAQVILRDQNLKFVTQTKLEDDESHPIESIDFHSSGEMLALASLSGITYVFETSKLGRNNQNVRLKLVHPDGVNGVKFCPGDLPRVSHKIYFKNFLTEIQDQIHSRKLAVPFLKS